MPPAFVDTPEKEAKWQRAKEAVMRRRKKKKKQMTSRDWGLTTHIFQRIKKAKVPEVFDVYSVDAKGKRTFHYRHMDAAKAREHIAKLRKLYGKHVQFGMQERAGNRFMSAMKKCIDVIEARRSLCR